MVLAVGCVMSFFGIGVDPAVKVYTAESYPTSVRATGTSVTEGVGRLFSGVIGPSLVPLLLDAGGVSAVYLLIGAVAMVAVVTVAIFGEETKGRTLEAITAPPEKISYESERAVAHRTGLPCAARPGGRVGQWLDCHAASSPATSWSRLPRTRFHS